MCVGMEHYVGTKVRRYLRTYFALSPVHVRVRVSLHVHVCVRVHIHSNQCLVDEFTLSSILSQSLNNLKNFGHILQDLFLLTVQQDASIFLSEFIWMPSQCVGLEGFLVP